MTPLNQYKLAFEISPVPMLLVSHAGEVILVNDGLNQLFGYKSGELVGKSVEVLIPDSVREYHPQLRDAYFRMPSKRGMGLGRDLYGKTRSGEVIPLELALEPVTIGDETWAMVAAVDISQRKAQEERLHLAMDASASAMVMSDEDGHIVLVNSAASSLFGYSADELIGSAVEQLVPKTARRVHPIYRSSFMSASTARPMGVDKNLYAVHRDGSEIPVEIALTPVYSVGQKMVMSTIIDLTERVATDKLMAEKAKQLESLNTELSRFAYSASHDLKAPLVTIVGLLDACLEDLSDGNLEELAANLKKTKKICARSAEKVEGVLQVAHADHDGIPAEEIDLASCIENIWQDFSAAANSRVELTLVLNHDNPVITERPALQVILENILSNAIRYQDSAKKLSTVNVTSSTKSNRLHISIADNGIGIPDDKQHLVFSMFKRIDDRSKDCLGLVLVKKQVERLGGEIDFVSQQGLGTEFRITIPLSDE